MSARLSSTRLAPLARLAILAALSTALGAGSAAAAPKAKKPFGPFDAGVARAVKRQGEPGKPRVAHPAVGDPAKVPGDGPAPPPLRLDPDIPERSVESPNALGGNGLSSNPLWFAALGYQKVLTRLDGPRCQHLPTCSRFASQAVARHGAVGILMGLDRLIRPTESSALRRLPEIEGWGGIRGFDPVENYEFWKTERFTGFPATTPEEPLALPSLAAAPSASSSRSPSPSSAEVPESSTSP
jgi:hypothetical protein